MAYTGILQDSFPLQTEIVSVLLYCKDYLLSFAFLVYALSNLYRTIIVRRFAAHHELVESRRQLDSAY